MTEISVLKDEQTERIFKPFLQETVSPDLQANVHSNIRIARYNIYISKS